MTHNGAIQIRRHMMSVIEDYRDDSGEINASVLAESACQDLDGWIGAEVPELFYDIAVELALFDEANRRQSMPMSVRGIINAWQPRG